ncbi:MalY/PatB family protein [Cellulomonas olei]|uniref:MalY/PatB family protein n=1 Tax=Cellulomonas sp. P4 TaxID=3142533 RepID=UPI0031BB6E5F
MDSARTGLDPAVDRRTVADLRAAGGLKWSLFPDSIGAFVAESDLGTAPAVREALREAVERERFGYLPPALADDLAEAYAGWSADRYGWQPDPARVRPVGDVMAAFRATVRHLTAPGSTIVLPTPAYMPFLTVPATLGRRVVEVPLVPDGDRLVHDLDAIGRALADGGGLLVLCNPHNPTGRVLDREELLGLARVADAHGARVFADEIHAPLVYPGRRHVPYASVDPVAAAHAVTATSASKAWNIPGLKCAQVVLGSDADAARWREVGEEYEHGASTPGVLASTAAYTDGGPWLDGLLEYLDGNRLLLADLLAEQLPAVRYTPPEGTYLAWLDCRGLGIGDHPGRHFARGGVALTDGPACGRAGRGFARSTLATPRPVLRETVALLAASVPPPA